MKKSLIIFNVLFVSISVSFCGKSELKAPSGPPFVHDVPSNWSLAQKLRSQQIQDYIKKNKYSFDRFVDMAVSETDGIPFFVLKLLPEVAPKIWGEKPDFLSVIGLYYDSAMGRYPAPRGIGFSGMTRSDPLANIDYASFTCGGCHIGQVRLKNGKLEDLVGGINTRFDIILFRRKVVLTLQKIYNGEKNKEKQEKLVVDAFLKLLRQKQKSDPNYFYNNFQNSSGRRFDAVYEKSQIDLFEKKAGVVIPAFVRLSEKVYSGWGVIAKKLYPGIGDRVMMGFAGMEDAISFNAVAANSSLKEKFFLKIFAPVALPSYPGMTDIMAIWDQDSRNPQWDKDQKDLINGGGQWNGHIPLPIYKNIAAQITIGFDNIDIRMSAFSEQLMNKLPAPAYPFEVDVALAEQGKILFEKNCAYCHQPNNGRVYKNIGTHMGRARVAGSLITIGAQSSFTKACSPDDIVDLNGVSAKPCGQYRGVSLGGKKYLAMTSSSRHAGYNALPLIGIWGQAPYLHNGSVPTLYHLLVPGERPDIFIKSRLDYDEKLVGFSWNPKVPASTGKEEGYVYDTGSSPIIGHQGHDTDIEIEGRQFRLNWTNDKAKAMAIIEYMKTL